MDGDTTRSIAELRGTVGQQHNHTIELRFTEDQHINNGTKFTGIDWEHDTKDDTELRITEGQHMMGDTELRYTGVQHVKGDIELRNTGGYRINGIMDVDLRDIWTTHKFKNGTEQHMMDDTGSKDNMARHKADDIEISNTEEHQINDDVEPRDIGLHHLKDDTEVKGTDGGHIINHTGLGVTEEQLTGLGDTPKRCTENPTNHGDQEVLDTKIKDSPGQQRFSITRLRDNEGQHFEDDTSSKITDTEGKQTNLDSELGTSEWQHIKHASERRYTKDQESSDATGEQVEFDIEFIKPDVKQSIAEITQPTHNDELAQIEEQDEKPKTKASYTKGQHMSFESDIRERRNERHFTDILRHFASGGINLEEHPVKDFDLFADAGGQDMKHEIDLHGCKEQTTKHKSVRCDSQRQNKVDMRCVVVLEKLQMHPNASHKCKGERGSDTNKV